jgi:hypothetical protein
MYAFTQGTPLGLAVPGPTIVAATRRLTAREGVARAARLLGIPRDTLTRLRGGVPVRRGTLIIAVQALSALDPTVHS